MRIESISLDLCIGNKASLVGVGQDHFFHRLKFLELIVDQTPIPACFNDGFAWPFQTGKKLRKPSCAIAFDSSPRAASARSHPARTARCTSCGYLLRRSS